MKTKTVLIEEDSPLRHIEVTYPFCFKTKEKKYEGVSYHRYLEDGRFECITIQDLQMNFQYGNRTNTIYALVGDHEFYFKQIIQRNELISQEEFDEKRKEFFERYKDYLEGAKYIATEVERMLSSQENPYQKNNENNIDIITNNDEENPF